MKEYLISVVSVILFLSILEIFVPNSKVGQLVKSIISIVSFLLMLSPIITLINKEFNVDLIKNDSSYSEFLIDYEKKIIKEEIIMLLSTNEIEVESVEIEGYENDGDFEVSKIYIKIVKDVISSEDEHIIKIDKAKSLVIERLYYNQVEVQVG